MGSRFTPSNNLVGTTARAGSTGYSNAPLTAGLTVVGNINGAAGVGKEHVMTNSFTGQNVLCLQNLGDGTGSGAYSAWRALDYLGKEKIAGGYGDARGYSGYPFTARAYLESSNIVNADGTIDSSLTSSAAITPLVFVTTGYSATQNINTTWGRMMFDEDLNIDMFSYANGQNFANRDRTFRYEGNTGRVGISRTGSAVNDGVGAGTPRADLDVFGNVAIGYAQSTGASRAALAAGYSAFIWSPAAIQPLRFDTITAASSIELLGSTTGGNHYTWNDANNGKAILTLFTNNTGVTRFEGPARLKTYTVATLPAGTAGDTAAVSDATAPTYLGALTGSGAVFAPVVYNGAAWVSH